MRLVEIFDSVQGEGLNMGRPCTFIRTASCNLSCVWCDEPKHRGAGYEKTLRQIIGLCHKKLVVVTGGEPTVQFEELKKLVAMLKASGHEVAVESNGSCQTYDELECFVTVSPKRQLMYSFIPAGVSELKYVVTEDFNADVAISERVREKFANRIWLQPCDTGGDSIKKMWGKCYEIAAKDERLRVGVQLHKFMGVM